MSRAFSTLRIPVNEVDPLPQRDLWSSGAYPCPVTFTALHRSLGLPRGPLTDEILAAARRPNSRRASPAMPYRKCLPHDSPGGGGVATTIWLDLTSAQGTGNQWGCSAGPYVTTPSLGCSTACAVWKQPHWRGFIARRTVRRATRVSLVNRSVARGSREVRCDNCAEQPSE